MLCVVPGCGCWLVAWRLSLNELGELQLCITSEPVGLEWCCLLLMSTIGVVVHMLFHLRGTMVQAVSKGFWLSWLG